MKNLLEEGFNVTGFDRNSYVGGLWHYNEENKNISVLPSQPLLSIYVLCGLIQLTKARFVF